MSSNILNDFPVHAPKAPTEPLRYIDIAVTATAPDFAGIYRGKPYHPPDFSAVLDRAATHGGVSHILLTGMSLSDIPFNLEIARRRQNNPPICRITAGIHPYHAAEPFKDPEGDDVHFGRLIERVKELLAEEPSLIGAYGELGLDWDHTEKASKEVQLKTFKRQLDVYIKEGFNTQLPLFLHCRLAFDDFTTTIEPYLPHLPLRGVVHSFVGSTGQMQRLVSMGFDISVNGFSLRDRESLEMVRDIPIDSLQIETDAPWGEIKSSSEVAKRYLSGEGLRDPPKSKKRDKFEMGCMVKERNESCNIGRVAFVVARLKVLPVNEVVMTATRRSEAMFFR